MHDPMVVAFEIRRPWPKRSGPLSSRDTVRWRWRPPFATLAGRHVYFPALVTVWHVEPGGRDAFEVCPHSGSWRWHVRHWHIQIRPLQDLRRWLLTRCTWCGGPSRKGSPVNVSHQWDGPRGRWWQGAPGLFHVGCSTAYSAHRSCTCEQPITEHDGYGRCARCTLFRGYGATDQTLFLYRAVKAQCAGGGHWTDADTRRVLAGWPAEVSS